MSTQNNLAECKDKLKIAESLLAGAYRKDAKHLTAEEMTARAAELVSEAVELLEAT